MHESHLQSVHYSRLDYNLPKNVARWDSSSIHHPSVKTPSQKLTGSLHPFWPRERWTCGIYSPAKTQIFPLFITIAREQMFTRLLFRLLIQSDVNTFCFQRGSCIASEITAAGYSGKRSAPMEHHVSFTCLSFTPCTVLSIRSKSAICSS